MYSIEFYRIDVENSQFTFLGESQTFSGLYYDKVRNGIGTCIFSLSVFDEFAKQKYLQRFSTVIVVKKSGTCVWFGVIGNENGSIQDVGGFVNVQAYTYLYLLKNRHTAKEVIYSQVEQCQLAWNLINYSQGLTNGDLLITQGTNPTSIKRDRTYNFYTISRALVNLTNVIQGFDFSFDPVFDSNNKLSSVKFNCYYPRQGRKRDDLGFLQEGTNIQVTGWTTISELWNQIIVEGSGTGSTLLYEDGDSALQKAYTRIERYEARKDISEPDTLEEYGDELLNENKVEGYRFSVSPNPNSDFKFARLDLGDSVLCSFNVGNRFNYNKREGFIEKLKVSVDDEGVDGLNFDVEIYG